VKTKPKYEKPVVRDLSTIQIAQGVCQSGGPVTPPSPCAHGDSALGSCTVGATVHAEKFCPSGNYASGGCVSGSSAF
jgi:hypothetical protein